MNAWRNGNRRLVYWHGEIVWLKNEDGDTIGYPDSRYTRRIRSDLAERNEFLAARTGRVPKLHFVEICCEIIDRYGGDSERALSAVM